MNAFLSFFRFRKGKRIVFADIGETSVKYAECEQQGKELMLLHWGAEAAGSPEQALAILATKPKFPVAKTYVSMPASLLKERVVQHTFVRLYPTEPIAFGEQKRLFEELHQLAQAELAENLQTVSGILSEDLVLYGLEIQTTCIDGYAVPRLEGFRGQNVAISALAFFTLHKHRAILDNILVLPDMQLVHTAQAWALFAKEKQRDGIYVDVGKETTRIAAVQEGSVLFVDELRMGGRDFTLQIARALSMSENVAQDFKERYAAGEFSFDVRKKLHEFFFGMAKKLLEACRTSLSTRDASLPPALMLFGGGSMLPEVIEAFQEADFASIPFSEKPAVSVLLPDQVWGFPTKTSTAFTPLALFAYGI